MDVPDYWWDGTQKQKLETQKVDLTTYDQRISQLNENISSHKTSGDHDGRYYTETEVNNLLAGKAGISHTHNYLPPVWENYDVTIYTNNFQGIFICINVMAAINKSLFRDHYSQTWQQIQEEDI